MLQDRGVAEMRIHASWGSGSQALSPVWCVHPLPLIMLNSGAIAESHIKIKITWSKQKWSPVWKGRLQLSAAWVVPHGGGCSYPFMAPRRPLLVCFWVWLFKLENHLVRPLVLQRRKVRSACAVCVLSRFSHVQLFLRPYGLWPARVLCPWGFSRQYWSELPCPPPGDFPDPGIKPASHSYISCIGKQVPYY